MNSAVYGTDVNGQRQTVRQAIIGKSVRKRINVPIGQKTVTKVTLRKTDRAVHAPTNVVDLPKEMLVKINTVIEEETANISKIMLMEGVTMLLAYHHATEYCSVAMRDGLGIEPPPVDNDVDEIIGNALKIRIMEYMTKKIKISPRYREQLLTRIVSKMMQRQYKYFESVPDIDRIKGVLR